MLSAPNLAPAIQNCHGLAIPFMGLTYRAIHPRWFVDFAAARPLYAVPGKASRYVPPAGPAALYAAFDWDTAYREGNQDFFGVLNAPGGHGIKAAEQGGLRPDPLVMLGTHISVSRLLDLANVNVRQTLHIQSDAELLAPWKLSPQPTGTQHLGDAVFADSFFEGILYPSAQNPNGRCAVIFPARLLASSRVQIKGFTVSLSSGAVTLPDAQLP
jgi:RES domain-containing protein